MMPALVALPHPVPPLSDGVITLRALRPADAEGVTAACQDPEIPRWTLVPSPYTLSHARTFIRTEAAEAGAGRMLALLAVDSDDRPLGCIGLTGVDRAARRAEIGYWVAREARGRGVASRAVALVRDWAPPAIGLRTLEILTREDNLASRRVAERAGFYDTGERRPPPRPGLAGGARSYVVYAWAPAPSDR
jgi:RimJ/RimL family protein N-acetyltransferase